MRRLASVAVGALLALGAGGVIADAAAPPPAQLQNFSCQTSLDPLLRGMSVTAVMRPLPGTQAMRMRFDLFRAAHRTGPYHAVHGRNLGDWLSPSDPTLGQQAADVWNVPHPIVGLPAPDFYRLRVTFRWLGPHGQRLGERVRTSAICHQLELRPDLAAAGMQIYSLPAQPGQYAYVATVANAGLTGAGPFDVQLAGAGSGSLTRTIAWLGAHKKRTVLFTGPACVAGMQLSVSVDPARAVNDDNRSNNAITVTCPPSPPGYTP